MYDFVLPITGVQPATIQSSFGLRLALRMGTRDFPILGVAQFVTGITPKHDEFDEVTITAGARIRLYSPKLDAIGADQ